MRRCCRAAIQLRRMNHNASKQCEGLRSRHVKGGLIVTVKWDGILEGVAADDAVDGCVDAACQADGKLLEDLAPGGEVAFTERG